MANRDFAPIMGSIQRGMVILAGSVTLGASGAVSAGPTRRRSGFDVAKTGSETGRYTITCDDKYNHFLGGLVTLIGPDDAAMTDAKGIMAVFRDDDIATDGTIELQFIDADSGADAEPQDSLIYKLVLFLANSGV